MHPPLYTNATVMLYYSSCLIPLFGAMQPALVKHGSDLVRGLTHLAGWWLAQRLRVWKCPIVSYSVQFAGALALR